MNNYPNNDTQFEDHTLTEVRPCPRGGFEIFYGSLGFYCPKDSPVVPKVGSVARFYGKGFGSSVRGLFIDGVRVFYRTETDDAVYHKEQLYGRDAADLLQRWDSGRTVFTINVGGFGPGYDQVIQITMFEVLRWLIDQKPLTADWLQPDVWSALRSRIEREVLETNSRIKELGLSRAQWGAAVQLAATIYRDGPITVICGAKRTIQTADNIQFVRKD